jgi:hypothetical protein
MLIPERESESNARHRLFHSNKASPQTTPVAMDDHPRAELPDRPPAAKARSGDYNKMLFLVAVILS